MEKPLRKVIYEQNNIEFAQYANGVMCAERVENNRYEEIEYGDLMRTAKSLGIFGTWEKCDTFTRWKLVE